MKICKYRVEYASDEIARFSNYRHAMVFAKAIKNSEVFDKTGLIARFDKGELALKFKHLNK